MVIKAIETSYRGYLFRSRLEARWAVFFDELGMQWEYEPEGYQIELPDGERVLYLPDFRITSPAGQYFYEIKPRGVTSDPKVSAWRTANHALREAGEDPPPVRLLSGDPLDLLQPFVELAERDGYWHNGIYDASMCPRCGRIGAAAYGVSGDYDKAEFGCQPCDFTTPGGGGHPCEVGLSGTLYAPHKGSLLILNYDWWRWLGSVRRAATKARSARFEHGEARG